MKHVENTGVWLKITDTETGEMKRLKMASDKQWDFINSLRKQLGQDPLKTRPLAYKASKTIEKLLEKTNQQRII